MISLPRLKILSRITTSDDDALLLELIDSAVAFVQTETNRYFGPPTPTIEYLLGRGIRELPLLSIPYIAASPAEADISVVEQKSPGEAVAVINGTAFDGFELRLSPRAARLQRAGGYLWKWGFEYVTTYTHGFDIDSLPADIERVLLSLIGGKYRLLLVQAASGGGTVRSQSIDNYSYTLFGPDDVKEILTDSDREVLEAWREPVLV